MSLDIIIVDDDAIVLFLHKTLISKTQDDFPVFAFESAEEALFHVINKKEESSFLILLDINMPAMNGWQFLEQLQDIHFSHQVFVAMVTSSINKADKIKAQDYPSIISFLEKPLSRPDFKLLIQETKKRL